jgi:hypothetical protein
MRAVLAAAAFAALTLSALAPVAQAQQSDAARAGLRHLEWPGKVERAPAPSRLRPPARYQPAYRPVVARAEPQPAPQAEPMAAPPASRFAPGSIYDPPPPAPAAYTQAPLPAPQPMAEPLAPPAAPAAAAPVQVAVAAGADSRARLYSLHRDYGEQPDRTPMPAPMFLDNVPIDLAAPPPADLRGNAARDAKDAGENPDTPGGAP